MKRTTEDQRDLLAGEYVLGTMQGPARERYDRLRTDDAPYCYAVDDWEVRLAPLAEALPEARPPESVWRNARAAIAADQRAVRRRRIAVGLVLTAAAVALAVVLALILG